MSAPSSAARERQIARLDSLSRWHAVAMLGGAAAALALHAVSVLAVVAVAAFARMIVAERRGWTESGAFGAANWVTLLRVALTAGFAAAADWSAVPRWVLVAGFLLVFALDGVDGWLARRGGTVSVFGSHFDMESDATFVMALGLSIFFRQDMGEWVLVGGALRYVYVLILAWLPTQAGPERRSRFGRHAFVAFVTGLLFALLLSGSAAVAAAAIGTLAVSWSFGRSFYWSYAARPGALAEPNVS